MTTNIANECRSLYTKLTMSVKKKKGYLPQLCSFGQVSQLSAHQFPPQQSGGQSDIYLIKLW